MCASKSNAKRKMEQKFLTMHGYFSDLKNKYHMAGHSVLVPSEDEIYVGEDQARYRSSSIRHTYRTDDFMVQ